ncbi:MAG: DUF4350 domain-containing protein [Brevundimonas sp.]|uniref:DUF4350 domain-containing protein n=1 Tax=Brevundimonas sp. TaxID=1871086 RepID=UPI0026336BA8|nr:DUF4350 domain-containing protein [Brevundimonas sp.]MDI6623761.1 DUF4350 domain-containing protein [Brevundimonas sp.]MDQ7812933.1 DUF4350 domain-containing protein [Brevundimonas sp.]
MRLVAFAFGLMALAAVAAPAAAQQQMVDPDFRPTVERPAYAAGQGPVVVIDEAHANFHRLEGQYAPFAALLRADGYQVRAGTQAFDAGGLEGVDVVVIANAGATQQKPTPPAFTEAEGAALEAWVRDGGRLLLIADHTPFGAAAEALAARFGVRMGTGYAFAMTDGGRDLTTNLTYPAEALGDHPIIAGRGDSERVDSVTAFTGQSLEGPDGATALLHMTDGARESPDLPTLQALADRLDEAGGSEAAVAELSKPALPAQGLAFEYGRGRVVVLGEAGMLSAQLIRYPPESGQADRRFGMNAAPGNARFGLNIMHWLSGLLP